MDREALHERVRRLLFASPALSISFVRGEFRSIFRGRGLDFESLREYTLDDDARLIDWNVSVRFAKPFVRSYREDRSLSLFLIVDRSASMDEGAGELSKGDMAQLAASLLGHAAGLRDMPVGGLHFAEAPFGYREPRRGRGAALAFAEIPRPPVEGEEGFAIGTEVLTDGAFERREGGAVAEAGPRVPALRDSIATTARLLKKRSLVIIISDFRSGDFREELAILARRHDVVAVRVTDSLERSPPSTGGFQVRDPETGETAWLHFGSRRFRRDWVEFWEADAARIHRSLADCRVANLDLDTGDDPALRLLEFFDHRRKRLT